MRQLAREFPSGLPVSSVLPAPGTMRTMTVDGLLQVKEWALAEGSQITIHMGEHTEERETSIDRWGIGAFHKGEEIGFLGPDVVAAHCVKLDEAELEIVARTGTQVSYNPVSNAYLGNGIAPITRMLELGIDVSLATDGGACSNTEDMLEALKFGVLMQKADAQDPAGTERARHPAARDGRRRPRPRAARRPRGARGRPARGLLPLRPVQAQVGADARADLDAVYAGEQPNVDTVVIDGKVVLEDVQVRVDRRAGVRPRGPRAGALALEAGRDLPARQGPALHALPLRPHLARACETAGRGRERAGDTGRGGGGRRCSRDRARPRLSRPVPRTSLFSMWAGGGA